MVLDEPFILPSNLELSVLIKAFIILLSVYVLCGTNFCICNILLKFLENHFFPVSDPKDAMYQQFLKYLI